MKKRFFIILCSVFLVPCFLFSQDVYPTHWWVGMKDSKLQLLIHLKNVNQLIPKMKIPTNGAKLAEGVILKAIHHVENPNYALLDLVIDKNTKPGKRSFKFVVPGSSFTIEYELKSRNKENGKTRVKGVTSEDLIYLIMPDRFSNGDPSNDFFADM